jgi:hypothetical protein
MEFRDVTDIPAVELDSLLARCYLGIYELECKFNSPGKFIYLKKNTS